MFPVKCKDDLPLVQVIIKSIGIRGRLGPLTVWVSNKEEESLRPGCFRMNKKYWTKVYEKIHKPSFTNFCTLDLSQNPIILKPGQIRAVYIHSTLENDEAIVYDNNRHRRTYDDALVSILTGRAHVSPTAFGTTPIWGWGNAWRDQREFVGRIEYGAVYKLWNPSLALNFGSKFQSLVRTMHLCQRRWESPLSKLPDDCIFYILNMCRWDWASDTPEGMKELKKKRKQMLAAAEERRREQDRIMAAASAPCRGDCGEKMSVDENAGKPACSGGRQQDQDGSNDEEFHDAASEEEEADEDDDDEYVDVEVMVDDEEDSEVDEEENDDDDDDDEDWEDDGYNANSTVFRYQDDSDEDNDDEGVQNNFAQNRQVWLRRTFARIHVLQALAALEDDGVTEMNFE
mmetsp:Transcript_20845/g.31418  ORF Transcript_20845/g.31418 Transcript_20845/m.31418 type:complete len:400 (+) Transcript_20845:296-1495(+)|eukprot:CAMPEP_0178935976 /NCGR_PEP_ID=MMETSP0786-20121207/24876_1 /TAXON_ID=186022 /ORGANISM="Thalassionema frauenfeldii, Strain CCMP 1798" /LENGTH=399 /DNA_ID=CAMNT_0020614247 /DNA_START=136 /DNA_END=1335 /DNA_ORIENTATION=+